MANVIIRNLEKKYSKRIQALKTLNFEIKDKEFIVIVGPSGCGKSTLLKIIAGLEKITSGEILIDNIIMNTVASRGRNTAMVFQNYALYPHMNVYENIAFGLKLRKIPEQERDKRVKNIAEKLEISTLLNRKPNEISGGEKQRVALGRALVRQPDVFLLDEPLSNLDTHLKNSIRLKIKQLHKELKTTTIYVTHDQTEAMTMGERIAVMKEGEIVQIGTPLTIYDYPVNKFVAGFIGSPKMNFTKAEVKITVDGKIILNTGNAEWFAEENKKVILEKYVGKNIIVGIRPEHICIEERESDFKLSGKVVLKEELGNEETIYFDFYGVQMVTRNHLIKSNEQRILPGESFYFSISKYYLFDPETESNILNILSDE